MKGPAVRRRRRFLWHVIALCGLLNPAWQPPAGAADARAEQSVKAAFTLRFAGYVDWPENIARGETFDIAVLGADQVAEYLQLLSADRTVQGRPVRVRRISSIREVDEAQILFVGSARRGDLSTLLYPLAGRSVLIVTEEEAALAAGSTINLLLADRRVRFEVSLAAARRARLKISSELLSLAMRVRK